MINLETVLENINNGYANVTNVIPDRFDFDDENVDIGPWDGGPGLGQAVFVQADGKLLWGGISGQKQRYDLLLDMWYYENNIVRFNADGSIDSTFTCPKLNGNGNGMVSAIGQQSSGKLIVGGYFNTVNGQSISGVMRLNTDGSVDDTFTGGQFNGNVFEVKILGDDSILVGHQASYHGSTSLSSRISKLSSNGVLNTSFDANATIVDTRCHSIAVLGDGSMIVGGRFSTGICKLNADGTTDTSFDVGSGFSGGYANHRVSKVLVQGDGKVLVGSWYKSFNGDDVDYVCRLNSDGSLDNTFATDGSGFLSGGGVNTIALMANGKVLVGGWFTVYNDNPQKWFALLNTNGTLDNTFDVATAFTSLDSGNSGRIQDIIVSGSKIYIAHGLASYQGNESFNLTVTDLSGTYNSAFKYIKTFNTDLWSGVFPLAHGSALLANGKLLVCGEIPMWNRLKGVRKYNVDGSEDATFACPYIEDTVRGLGVQSTGKIVIVGEFDTVETTPCSYIARLNADGSFDDTFNLIAVNNSIWHVEVLADDKLIITGQFTQVDGTDSYRIARLTANGELDMASTVLDNYAWVSKTDSNGKIYVGGRFSGGIIRLLADGTADSAFDVGTGFENGVGNNPRVSSIEFTSGGKLMVGHWFTSYNGASCSPGISQLNTDGTLDSSFETEGSGLVWTESGQLTQAVKVLSSGKILVGGWFNEYNGEPQLKLIRLNSDGSKDTSFDIGLGFGYWSRIQRIEADANGIYVTGDPTVYNEWARYPVVRLLADGQIDTTYKSKCWAKLAGINDGGDDMFDEGNFIYTNLTQDFADGISDSLNQSLALPNTHTCLWGGEGGAGWDHNDGEYVPLPDGEIISCDDYFGTGSTYFTNMYQGFFVMGVNNMSIDQFSVMGDMGSSGTQDLLDFKVPGHNYHCFTKIHHDSGDPSAHMMILVPGSAAGIITMTGPSNGYQDFGIEGLTSKDHLFYLLIAGQPDLPIAQQDLEIVAAQFLQEAGVGGYNSYQMRLSQPFHATEGGDGSLDTTIVNGVSLQRSAYLELVNGTDRKVVAPKDGQEISDEPQALTDYYPCEQN
jgi:uncharacterized delta-60 repeat protein